MGCHGGGDRQGRGHPIFAAPTVFGLAESASHFRIGVFGPTRPNQSNRTNALVFGRVLGLCSVRQWHRGSNLVGGMGDIPAVVCHNLSPWPRPTLGGSATPAVYYTCLLLCKCHGRIHPGTSCSMLVGGKSVGELEGPMVKQNKVHTNKSIQLLVDKQRQHFSLWARFENKDCRLMPR